MTNNDNPEKKPVVGGYVGHPNVRQVMQEEGQEDEQEVWSDNETIIRERIEHVLRIYPRISGGMLQVGIGTSIPPALWRPIYKRMLAEGIVIEGRVTLHGPTGRVQDYTIIQHRDNIINDGLKSIF